MIKCSYCGKDVERKLGGGKVISIDGDLVCDDKCHKKFRDQMNQICNMNDDEFEKFILSEDYEINKKGVDNDN